MRTTLTLDDDVAAILERLRKSRDASPSVSRRDQSRLAGCELRVSITLAKPSPLPRAKPTSDIGRRQHSHLRTRELICSALYCARLARSAIERLRSRRPTVGEPARFPSPGDQSSRVRTSGTNWRCVAAGPCVARMRNSMDTAADGTTRRVARSISYGARHTRQSYTRRSSGCAGRGTRAYVVLDRW